MNFLRKLLFLLLITLPFSLLSQEQEQEPSPAILVNFEFGYNVSSGDYSKRFGNNLGVGGGVDYITKKNLIFGINSTYYFSNNVKEDVLSEIRNDDGFLIGNNKIHANVALRQRALYIGGSIGKIFSFNKINKRSGVRASLGAGYFQHKIRIQEDPNSFVPIVAGDYKKGWDRLSSGLGLRQFIGYQHLSLDGLINFYIGVEMIQGFTQNQRAQDFKLMTKLDENRLDLLFGLKAGWTLPFTVGINPDQIYY